MSPGSQPPQSIRPPQPSLTWPHLSPAQASAGLVVTQAGLPHSLATLPPPHHSSLVQGPLLAFELQSTVLPQPSAKIPHFPGQSVAAVNGVQLLGSPAPHTPGLPPPPQDSPSGQGKP